jgi:RNA polymerase sigma factor (TIGR02999 family)
VSSPPEQDITQLLREWSSGDTQALPRLVSLVYPELRRIAERHLRGERPGHTLQPTALVHEAYLRFAQQQPGKEWTDRTHFFAVAAPVVRAVLVAHARARGAMKRGDGAVGVELEEGHQTVDAPAVDILDLNAALEALEVCDRNIAGSSSCGPGAARGTATTAGREKPHGVGVRGVGEHADARAGTDEEVSRHRHASGMSVSVPLCSR